MSDTFWNWYYTAPILHMHGWEFVLLVISAWYLWKYFLVGFYSMHPSSVVLLYEDGRLALWEIFFSAAKARRAFDRAKRKDATGYTTLEHEDGGFTGTSAITEVKLIHLDWTGTKKEFDRKSFLNLTAEEKEELCARYDIPLKVIEQIAQAERDIIEAKHYVANRYDELAKARMRKYLPRFLLSRIFYK
jgi:hypothetical protein